MTTSQLDQFDIFVVSESCGVDLGLSYVVTGGRGEAGTRVSVYTSAGWSQDLAPLNQGRSAHACAKYQDDNGDTVSTREKGGVKEGEIKRGAE